MSGLEDFVTVHGNQRFVGGDHVLAVGDRRQHQFASDIVTANQLHQNIHIGVGGNFKHIRGGIDAGNIAVRMNTAVSNLLNHNRTASTTRNIVSVAGQYVKSAATDSA